MSGLGEKTTKYTSGALFSALPGVILPLREGKKNVKARPLCFLLTSEGGLQVRSSVGLGGGR